jgi:hypothetical protein
VANATTAQDARNCQDAQDAGDLQARLRARAHQGGPGNLGLAATRARVEDERGTWQARLTRFDTFVAALTHAADRASTTGAPAAKEAHS